MVVEWEGEVMKAFTILETTVMRIKESKENKIRQQLEGRCGGEEKKGEEKEREKKEEEEGEREKKEEEERENGNGVEVGTGERSGVGERAPCTLLTGASGFLGTIGTVMLHCLL